MPSPKAPRDEEVCDALRGRAPSGSGELGDPVARSAVMSRFPSGIPVRSPRRAPALPVRLDPAQSLVLPVRPPPVPAHREPLHQVRPLGLRQIAETLDLGDLDVPGQMEDVLSRSTRRAARRSDAGVLRLRCPLPVSDCPSRRSLDESTIGSRCAEVAYRMALMTKTSFFSSGARKRGSRASPRRTGGGCRGCRRGARPAGRTVAAEVGPLVALRVEEKVMLRAWASSFRDRPLARHVGADDAERPIPHRGVRLLAEQGSPRSRACHDR